MAEYKVVDATQLDTDMETLANSIRAKAGIEDKLVFPDGMIAAVNGIETGGDTSVEDGFLDGTLSGEYTNNRITSVKKYGISFCTALTKIDLPNVTQCGDYAFSTCTALTSVNIPKLETTGKYMFTTCTSLESANFPLLTSVPSSMFSGCTNLVTVDLGVAVSIDTNAFNMTKKLKQLILRSPTTVTLANALYGAGPIASGTGYIYVPSALIDAYKTATNWSTYAAQFRALEDYTVDGTTTGELDAEKI